MLAAVLHVVISFADPSFPALDVDRSLFAMPAVAEQLIDERQVTHDVDELNSALDVVANGTRRVLVWRHGSAFPAESWPHLIGFLERGGSIIHFGGEPFTRPVIRTKDGYFAQPRTVSLLKELRLNQSYWLGVGGGRLECGDTVLEAKLPPYARVAILEPRLTETRDFANEDGAPGSRDARITPIAQVFRAGETRFPIATATFAVDRLRGRFAGGRWLFRTLSIAAKPAEMRDLVTRAFEPVRELRLDPTFGCFHAGERPSVLLRAYVPRATVARRWSVTLSVADDRGEFVDLAAPVLTFTEHGTQRVDLGAAPAPFAGDDAGAWRPGLYRVRARVDGHVDVTSGFWIFDPVLFRSGDALTFDDYTLRRSGIPEPIIGTTMMSGDVHRKFLFEPNAALWDDTFRELADVGINLVRTGVWSAYRKISLDPNVVDEAWLRALEAYYLCARRHGIPVVFTLFAFMPEAFGGVSPYFDPRSIEGQRAYVGAVAQRFAEAKGMHWDLINEPSFASPSHLWQCRPQGDAFEARAFCDWLAAKYGGERVAWQHIVSARWRLRPGDGIGVPADGDFSDREVFEDHRPYRAKEYAAFAQDAFGVWVGRMTAAIREAGSKTSITVGQDEGGFGERPHPLCHHCLVDYTSMHTWWFNDALLWDGLLAKGTGTPLLLSESGIMQRELLSGEALRTPDDFAALLSRKIGYAFAAGAFGIVQWCYEVNPYMASDNEVAIGLKRVDGSYKPEHEELRRFAEFIARNRNRFDRPTEPDVVLLLPAGDHYGPRDMIRSATQRAIDVLVRELGLAVRVVHEARTAKDLGQPRFIVLPACRGIADDAWQDLLTAVDRGAFLMCSGWFEADDASLPALRLGAKRRPLHRFEQVTDDATLEFPLAATESWFAADHRDTPRVYERGKGAILHFPVPIEWAFPTDLQISAYEIALGRAGVEFRHTRYPRGLFVRTIVFRRARLVIAINETSAVQEVHSLVIPVGRCRMFFIDRGDQVIDVSHR